MSGGSEGLEGWDGREGKAEIRNEGEYVCEVMYSLQVFHRDNPWALFPGKPRLRGQLEAANKGVDKMDLRGMKNLTLHVEGDKVWKFELASWVESFGELTVKLTEQV